MSHYEWERGTITLPSAAVVSVKKDLRDNQTVLHDAVKVAAVALHKKIATGVSTLAAYKQALNTYERQVANQSGSDSGTRSGVVSRVTLVNHLAMEVITRGVWSAERAARTIKPTQPTTATVSLVIERPTNRSASFPIFGAWGSDVATVDFAGSRLTWNVDENNHAVDHAHEAPAAIALFAALNQITWTRNTGGHFVGNDEYHRDDDNAGGGGNYTTMTFGPLGIQEKTFEYMRSGFSRTDATRMASVATRPTARSTRF